MFFHWLKLYGKASSHATTVVATAVVDTAFRHAVNASPAIFEADSTLDAVGKAKFEHVCPWLAQEIAGLDPKTTRSVVEAMVDRIEVGLREASVGDMKVGREVRTYAAALNGRLQRYVPLIQQNDWREMAAAMAEHNVDAAVAGQLEAYASKKAA